MAVRRKPPSTMGREAGSEVTSVLFVAMVLLNRFLAYGWHSGSEACGRYRIEASRGCNTWQFHQGSFIAASSSLFRLVPLPKCEQAGGLLRLVLPGL